MDDLAEALAAAVGGTVSTLTLYPIEIVKNNLQVGDTYHQTPGSKTQDAVSASRRTARKEHAYSSSPFLKVSQRIFMSNGVAGFYSGVQSACSSAALEKLIYYYSYSLLLRTTQAKSSLALLTIGYISEFLHLPITMVFEKVMIAQQVGAKVGRRLDFGQEFTRTVKEEGWMSFYSGWRAYFVLAAKPAIENALFERFRSWILKPLGRTNRALSGVQAFLLGGVARAIATLIVYPAYRALRIQQGKSKTEKAFGQSPHLASELYTIVTDKGLMALYKGFVADVCRGILSSALRSSIKERLSIEVKNVFLSDAGAQ